MTKLPEKLKNLRLGAVRPHLDAVRAGVLAFLRGYPLPATGPAQGLRPESTHTLHWADDYGRGVEMARACLLRACKDIDRSLDRKGDAKLAAMALREMEEGEPLTALDFEGLSDQQRSAWDGLLVFLDNLLRTGDPDTSVDADVERAEEEEPA